MISPLLANIYLDKLDKFVEQTLIPEYTKGKTRHGNPEYKKLAGKIRRLTENGAPEEILEPLLREFRWMRSTDEFDPNYRRLRYIRYADDFLLGFSGPKEEAEEIKCRIREFLQDNLKLELSQNKTLITNALADKARFLGYHASTFKPQIRKRGASGHIVLSIPPQVLEEKIARYIRDGEPIHRTELLHDDDFSIVTRYGAEYRGIVQYYAFARNRFWLNRLHWVMWSSLFKTLSGKHKTTTRKLIRSGKYTANTISKNGVAKCVQMTIERKDKPPLIARFGGIALTPEPFSVIDDLLLNRDRLFIGRAEIIQRFLADACEICGSRKNVQVHHVRKLADVQKKGRPERPYYAKVMAGRRRKTLVVCEECHDAIHAGKPTRKPHQPI